MSAFCTAIGLWQRDKRFHFGVWSSFYGGIFPLLVAVKADSSVSTPVKELKGFEKISLAPDEKKAVSFRLTPDQLSLLDINLKPVVEPGTFSVMVGSSSEDIRLEGSFEVK